MIRRHSKNVRLLRFASAVIVIFVFFGTPFLAPGLAWAGPVSVRMPIEFRTWKIEQSGVPDVRISTWSVPWISTIALSSRSALVISGEGLSTNLTRPDQRLDDLSEVAAQLRHEFSGLPLTWMASVAGPGTQPDVSADSREIREWLSHPLLATREQHLGRGIDLGSAAIWSPPLGNRGRLAFGLGVEVPGSYKVGEIADYRPGAELSASLGLEWRLTTHSSDAFLFRLTGRTFGRDEMDDDSGIREGDQLDASLRTFHSFGSWRLNASTQASWKGNGERSDLDLFEVRSPGWLGAADFSWIYLGAPWQAGLRAEARRFDGARDDARYGWSAGVGPVLSAGRRLRFRAEALYLQSRWEDGNADATGTSIRLTLGYLP